MLIEENSPATCEQELYPFNFLLASCQESSSELQGNELGSELGSELTSLVGSELGTTSYMLIEENSPATCEHELYPFNFLLASCQESSSELQGNELGSELTSLACSELGLTSYRDTLGTTSEGGVLLRPERPRIFDDLNDNEKKRFDADVRATNIMLQGLPKYIYKLINHNIEAKAIWDNIKMLLAGFELTKEDRESQLYDEFEHFKMLLGENINEYYVRFHKLVNDMRNIKMTMPNIQLNSKFMNNMSPKWDRFVTSVKLNKGLKETNHEQQYAYLKQHEKYAAQDRLIIKRITLTTNDQLEFVSSVQPYTQSSPVQSHQYPPSSAPLLSPHVQSLSYPQFAESSQLDSGYTQANEILDTLTKQVALLAQSFRATLPQRNNQLRTSSNTRNQATVQDGRVVVQNVQG
nr:retrovirus-related Pol polyprotein from transposon TNT 1-94 [Tanacetum cinerariifolium]